MATSSAPGKLIYEQIKSFGFPEVSGISPFALIKGSSGNLFGVTSVGGPIRGSIFTINAATHEYRVLHSFEDEMNGWLPLGLAVCEDETLYGINQAGRLGFNGTVFKLEPNGTTYRVLHEFGFVAGEGYSPTSLILGSDRVLYGATRSGGTNGDGIVFRLNTNGTDFQVLHTPDYSGGEITLVEGSDGVLYGTIQYGGLTRNGALFKLRRDGTGYNVMHTFSGADGANLRAPLLHGTDGVLYGVTRGGGAAEVGMVFRLSTNGTDFRILHDFSVVPGDGRYPETALIQGGDGFIYGTTADGGSTDSADRGTVFKLATNGTEYAVLRTFTGMDGDGRYPSALIEGATGLLYGLTFHGGFSGDGTFFSVAKAGGGYEVLRNFGVSGGDGRMPTCRLVEGHDGALFGTTYDGGREGAGTAFRLQKDGTDYRVLHSFALDNGEGRRPYAGLLQGSDGSLFGVTSEGSTNVSFGGVTFRVGIDGSNYVVLYDLPFEGASGTSPSGDLIEGGDGALYGSTLTGGTNGGGSVFRLNQDGSGYALLHSFSEGDGSSVSAGVIEGVDGALYGTAVAGGAFQPGCRL